MADEAVVLEQPMTFFRSGGVMEGISRPDFLQDPEKLRQLRRIFAGASVDDQQPAFPVPDSIPVVREIYINGMKWTWLA